MLDKINQAILEYQEKWQKLADEQQDSKYFAAQQPTAVAFKTTDLHQLLDYFDELRQLCDQIHWGWVNERWLVTMHLKDQKLNWGISLIKLMQRRPGSEDPVGLDHIDFYNSQNNKAPEILAKTDLKWTEERNENNCSWISIWFDNTESKLRTDTVLNPCITELKQTNRTVLIDKSET